MDGVDAKPRLGTLMHHFEWRFMVTPRLRLLVFEQLSSVWKSRTANVKRNHSLFVICLYKHAIIEM